MFLITMIQNPLDGYLVINEALKNADPQKSVKENVARFLKQNDRLNNWKIPYAHDLMQFRNHYCELDAYHFYEQGVMGAVRLIKQNNPKESLVLNDLHHIRNRVNELRIDYLLNRVIKQLDILTNSSANRENVKKFSALLLDKICSNELSPFDF